MEDRQRLLEAHNEQQEKHAVRRDDIRNNLYVSDSLLQSLLVGRSLKVLIELQIDTNRNSSKGV